MFLITNYFYLIDAMRGASLKLNEYKFLFRLQLMQ
jgi:hypothetical protein